jgi:moderate conductance mechanosensitive channel
VVFFFVPRVDSGLGGAGAAGPAKPPSPESPVARLVTSYEPVLRRAIHIVTVIAGALAVAAVWNLPLFALAQRGLGGRVASSLFGTGLVLLLAYMLWEVAKTAIDRRITVESAQPANTPATRLRTLLPLLRVSLAITILVMSTLSILAALGVDIVPLLAGASVIGLAVGFGSQALVRDVVSGAFFLMDDAFRLGEYIEVGDAKGRIEKITVRSLFLRHHRGPLNVLPYGEIKRLRNNSRDWMIMVLEFRLAFGTDLRKVKKILKEIGEKLKADPDYADDILQPLKSQGVMATDDSALTVRAKYMARPGDGTWVIRRVAYEMILKAFAENGIEFASRRVSVHVPPGTEPDGVRAAAAAMAAQMMDPVK